MPKKMNTPGKIKGKSGKKIGWNNMVYKPQTKKQGGKKKPAGTLLR